MRHDNTRSNRSGSQAAEFLSFRLGSEAYGIDILKVQEIRGYEQPTRLANAPDYLRGVLNLRGVIVPVIDLRVKFGMADVPFNTHTVTIVLTVLGRVVGVVVDSVSDVIELDPSQIRPAPEFTDAACVEHVVGMASPDASHPEHMIILMDIEKLMGSADMGLLEQAPAEELAEAA